MGTGVVMIDFDFGSFGKARISRPTLLEALVLSMFLVFLGVAIWMLR